MRVLVAFCCVTVLLSGCRSEGKSLEVSEVLNLQNCEQVQAGVAKVSFAEIAAIRGSKLIDLNALGAAQGQASKSAGTSVAPVAESGVQNSDKPNATARGTAVGPVLVVVSKGRQSTAGYGFELDRAELKGKQVDLHLRWKQPQSDSLQAQMLTSPCIVVALARSNYQKVIALDSTSIIGEVQL